MAVKGKKAAGRGPRGRPPVTILQPPALRGKRAAGAAPVDRAVRVRARKILGILEKAHRDARIYLNARSPWQLLIATILAAQCTDERVNEVTPLFFARYPDAAHLAGARSADVEGMIRSTGFFRQKARTVIECSQVLTECHGGDVPADVDALTSIGGVGRKTANVVLSNAFGQPAIAVDTHVQRVAGRLGMATAKDPDKIERQLCGLIPRELWTRATHVLGTHGRRICIAKKPDCEHCPVSRLCDYYRSLASGPGAAAS
jgi:endonuclease-3